MLRENIIVGEHTKYPLKGMLTIPKAGEAPFPAVVFVHGSGSSNMDEKVGKLTPFRDLAEGLARHGIASIRYDKRSFAHGLRMVRDKSTALTVKEETVDDAILATRLLREDPRIDSARIFLVGHSMGAMLAPRIDKEGGDYCGLVLMAGTLRRLEEVMLAQLQVGADEMTGLMRFIAKKQLKKMGKLFDGLYERSDEEAKAIKVAGGTTLYYFKEIGEYPTADYLRNLEKPVLIMQGEKDVQVRADLDFRLYRDLLEGRPNVTFKLYEGLNHAFVPAVATSFAEASKEFAKERHIGEDVIGDLARWILRQ